MHAQATPLDIGGSVAMDVTRRWSTKNDAPNAFVGRILQMALGFFVTTSELTSNHDTSLGFNCSFDTPCRWQSLGNGSDHWRLAKGEPEPLLWLAAMKTMQLPNDAFTLIELQSNPGHSLTSDLVECQSAETTFSFTYWATNSADIEICLTDQNYKRFNCTGMLESKIMPGKVMLKIPPLLHPFHIAVVPNTGPGLLIIDDIVYDIQPCVQTSPSTLLPDVLLPWTFPKLPGVTASTENPFTQFPPLIPQSTTPLPTTTTSTTTTTTTSAATTTTTPVSTTSDVEPNTTEYPFDLLILGEKTRPLFDGRKGTPIFDNSKLLCDFGGEFPCQWGADSGKWAIINEGAIPSYEGLFEDKSKLPSYPAAIVLQGQSTFTSDPIRCQRGPGKVVFRYWTNGNAQVKVCVSSYEQRSTNYECFAPSKASKNNQRNIAAVVLPHSIMKPFLLNLVPFFDPAIHDEFVIIDEIAYIGECDSSFEEKEKPTTALPVIKFTKQVTKKLTGISSIQEMSTQKLTEEVPSTVTPFPRRTVGRTTLTLKESFTLPQTITPRMSVRIPNQKQPTDYCKLLNCSFNQDACKYLNHGLTKVPWTLRTTAYGFPLTRITDIHTSPSNGQFISTALAPGDFAILESPKFNTTHKLNVLLFQYYRSTYTSTIRLCIGNRYSKTYWTVEEFLLCPPILRSLTTKSAFKWNNIHVQLPPGTTNFFLVAHNLNRAAGKTAIGIDNIRVAICDPRDSEARDLYDGYDDYN
ncbi:hypothetical protein L596_006085 [Steinernema carpocapsae]|uniref:MAM domain-containing protein n=2 Tax=Steinernema carpocapsae TaxID=34508 RepID=A0A4U8V2H1_STECR|nr:hypothetical protein L596_006085 [Steinernema carpocapsae]